MHPPVQVSRERRLSEAPRQQECHHERGDQEADDHRLDRHVRAERGGTHNGAANQQHTDPAQHGDRERRQHQAIPAEGGGVRQVGDAEAREKFDHRIAAERDEAPEHKGMGQSGQGPLDERLPLTDDVDQEAFDALGGVLSRKRVRRGGNETHARGHLRRKRADKSDRQQPQEQRLHLGQLWLNQGERSVAIDPRQALSAAIKAGTISNRSPTMP